MADINEVAFTKLAENYYGPGAVIGDGTLLKMILDALKGLLGGCIGGASRAHKLVNGTPRQQRLARNRLVWDAYDRTGDIDEANKQADAAMAMGKSSTADEFVEFAKS